MVPIKKEICDQQEAKSDNDTLNIEVLQPVNAKTGTNSRGLGGMGFGTTTYEDKKVKYSYSDALENLATKMDDYNAFKAELFKDGKLVANAKDIIDNKLVKYEITKPEKDAFENCNIEEILQSNENKPTI